MDDASSIISSEKSSPREMKISVPNDFIENVCGCDCFFFGRVKRVTKVCGNLF